MHLIIFIELLTKSSLGVSIIQSTCMFLLSDGLQAGCSFNNPLICAYTVDCSCGGSKKDYMWRRHSGSTSTEGTGPESDMYSKHDNNGLIKSGWWIYWFHIFLFCEACSDLQLFFKAIQSWSFFQAMFVEKNNHVTIFFNQHINSEIYPNIFWSGRKLLTTDQSFVISF